ncbi:MAG: hypothetical protein ACK4PI_13100 [Tepidisphaerales bacterium]
MAKADLLHAVYLHLLALRFIGSDREGEYRALLDPAAWRGLNAAVADGSFSLTVQGLLAELAPSLGDDDRRLVCGVQTQPPLGDADRAAVDEALRVVLALLRAEGVALGPVRPPASALPAWATASEIAAHVRRDVALVRVELARGKLPAGASRECRRAGSKERTEYSTKHRSVAAVMQKLGGAGRDKL